MTRAPRRLTILDLSLLVVFAALSLAGFQFATTRIFPRLARLFPLARLDRQSDPPHLHLHAVRRHCPLIPLAGGWTGLLLVQRFIPPRPLWRRIARQPGMAACLAAAVAFFWVAICSGVLLLLMWFFSFSLDPIPLAQSLLLGHLFPLVGLAVASTWSHFLFSGRWQPSYDWIDLTGRIVGLLWILIGLAWTLPSYEALF